MQIHRFSREIPTDELRVSSSNNIFSVLSLYDINPRVRARVCIYINSANKKIYLS